MSNSLTLAGAHVVVYVNSRVYAQVSGFTWSSTTPRKVIYELDSVIPAELAQTITSISGSLKLFRLIGDGGVQGPGMVAPFEDLSKERYFSLQLIERRSDTCIFSAGSCSVESESWSAEAKGLITGTMNFKALTWTNEVKPK